MSILPRKTAIGLLHNLTTKIEFNSTLERAHAETILENWNEFCKFGSYHTFRRLELAGFDYTQVRDRSPWRICDVDEYEGDETCLRELDERNGPSVDEPPYRF